MPRELKQIAVLSGKGGTGKTTVLASFAALSRRAVLADCDVDAANLHLLVSPEVREQSEFWGAKVAVRDPGRCRQVGECERRCRFGAITTDKVDVRACEGCGMCVLVCPNNALRLEPTVNGHCYLSDTPYGPMAHARLVPAGESSGRLVTRVRQMAEEAALDSGRDLVLIDGPPGIGCTAVASMAEVNLVVIVTEPTLAGMHDMERVVTLAQHFALPVAAIINKADINEANALQIRAFAADNGIPILAELPFDEVVVRAIASQTPLVLFGDGPVSAGIRRAWEQIQAEVFASSS
jgi:MinD superfamily P-loop ATPase